MDDITRYGLGVSLRPQNMVVVAYLPDGYWRGETATLQVLLHMKT